MSIVKWIVLLVKTTVKREGKKDASFDPSLNFSFFFWLNYGRAAFIVELRGSKIWRSIRSISRREEENNWRVLGKFAFHFGHGTRGDGKAVRDLSNINHNSQLMEKSLLGSMVDGWFLVFCLLSIENTSNVCEHQMESKNKTAKHANRLSIRQSRNDSP